MAREYGKVLMSAWTNTDFTNVSRRAQGTFFFLTSQPDLNRAGVITIALNRWASRCAENDRQVILDDLAELARGRFVVVDEAQEELLVRTYIRNDDGWKSPNIMVAIAAAARQVSSETLRAVIADELRKIDTTHLPTTINAKTNRSTREFIESVIAGALESLSMCDKDADVMAYGTLTETLSERVTETLPDQGENERVTGRVTERVSRGFLTTTTPETETAPETETETSPSAIASIDEGFETFWDAYDKKHGKKNAQAKWRLALKKPGVTADMLIDAAVEYIEFQRVEGKHPMYTKDPSSWLNGEHWNDERASRQPHRSRPANKAEERIQSHVALVEQLRAEEQQQATHLRAIEGSR